MIRRNVIQACQIRNVLLTLLILQVDQTLAHQSYQLYVLHWVFVQNACRPAALYRLSVKDVLKANELESRTDEENNQFYSVPSTSDKNFARTLSK